MNILVVGGAGYIGSHCVRQIAAAGHRPVVLDNLVHGHKKSIPGGVPFHHGDLGDQPLVRRVLRSEKIDIVMHFAAFTLVGESVGAPIKYYRNNVARTLSLLETMQEEGVGKFIFSSTAAVYGIPEKTPIPETAPKIPINPYGQTKLDCENMLGAFARAYGLSFAVFRYFNACGAAEDGSIGEDHTPETHLVPNVIRAALRTGPALHLFGSDYPTPDGTCLRDYVHVDDLSRAHIAAFDKLETPGTALHFNLGLGRPYSNMEIVKAVEKVSGLPVPFTCDLRRAGDPPELCADASLARTRLGWNPRFTDIHAIVETAWRWHRNHPAGFDDQA
ncbi:MAG: UDP-glucose 4-epimerase GalE [Puniceicoccales bacterium]|jgi:UDP-glucose 4-epimerase|nr:UDP-glucose 4-epimerase GalE [Puniceicoccales bacterium]